MSVRPAVRRTVPARDRSLSASGMPASSWATIALKPRSMLMPWSPSPIAWSSAVSAAACSWIRSALSRSQLSSASNIGRIPRRTVGWECSGAATAGREPERWPRNESGSDAPAHGGRVDWRIPELRELGVEAQEGDREAGHLQARDVVAHERAVDDDAEIVEDLGDAVEGEVELDKRGPAH